MSLESPEEGDMFMWGGWIIALGKTQDGSPAYITLSEPAIAPSHIMNITQGRSYERFINDLSDAKFLCNIRHIVERYYGK